MVFRKRPRGLRGGLGGKWVGGAFESGSDSDGEAEGRRRAAEVLERKHAKEREEGERAAQRMDGFGLDIPDGDERPGGEAAKPSRYIAALKVKADDRKMESERVMERQVQRERDAEGDVYQDKEKFVTSGYRARLAEREEWESKQKELDANESAIAGSNMAGFYRNLLDGQPNLNRRWPPQPAEPPKPETPGRPTELGKHDTDDHPAAAGAPRDDTNRKTEAASGASSQPVETLEARQIRLSARRNTPASIEAARQRYLERQQQRELTHGAPKF